MDKKELKAIVEIKDGELLAIASTEDKDRVGDSLSVADWDFVNFKKNPVLQAGHDYRPEFTIGKVEEIKVEGKKVMFKPVFHTFTELARGIKDMYENGFLKAFSVGFLPGEKRNELLEISAVAVPANPYALLISKALSIKTNEMEEIKKWVGSEEKAKTEKSPACRMSDESKDECVARKIPEIMDENPEMDNDQATAMAFSMCDKLCESKSIKAEEPPKEPEKPPEEVKEDGTPVNMPATEEKPTDEFISHPPLEEEKPKEDGVPVDLPADKKLEDATLKEGRVISGRNREVIKSATGAMKAAIEALEKLLEMTDEKPYNIEKDIENNNDTKSRELKEVDEPIKIDKVVLRALQKIASNSNYALNKIKKNK